MPVDPEISLHVGQPQATSSDPLESIARFAGIQNALNQNRLFQQTYAARQRSGQILASSPDTETAIRNLLADPVAAPFAGETIAALRQGALSLQQLQGEQQSQAISGLGAMYKALPLVLAGGDFDKVMQSQLSALSPVAKQRAMETIYGTSTSPGLKAALFDGLPQDPQQARAVLNQRIVGATLSAGYTPDTIRGVLGTPTTIDTGAQKIQGVQLPPQLGGGFSGATSVPQGIPPQYVGGPGEIKTLQPGGYPQGTPAPTVGGAPMSPLALDANKALIHSFENEGVTEYKQAQNMLANTRYIDQSLDYLARQGGWTTPGTAEAFRGEVAKAIGTLEQITGINVTVDPKAIASYEDLNKASRQLGSAFAKQTAGGGHLAYMTINTAMQSVPGLDNSYLGAKLLNASIAALAQRQMQERQFQTDWMSSHDGKLTGAVEAFAKANPPEEMANGVLGRFGMDAHGFKSPQDIGFAVRQGLLTPEAAASMLEHQFPEQFKKGAK